MARLYMCAAGNCHEEMEPKHMVLVRETDGSQHRFCSYRHAAEWLAHRAVILRPPRNPVPPSDDDAPDMLRRLAGDAG